MYLVTGATGLLGNTVARELLARGEEVRVYCRAASDRRALADLNVQVVEGELSDPTAIERAVQGCRAVIHSAAYIHIGWGHFGQSREVNVKGTGNVVAACKATGCRMVHVSTVDTIPPARKITNPMAEHFSIKPKVPCAYVVSKIEAEMEVRAAIAVGLDAVIVNPGFMLGPFDWKPSSGRMMLEISRAPLVIAPGGGACVCDVRDVASAIFGAIDLGRVGESYILGGWNISYKDLWNKMLATMGRKQRAYSFPYAVAAFGRIIDVVNRIAGRDGASPNGAEIAMGGLLHYYDSTKARRELNYRIRPLEQSLCDGWNWLKEHHASSAQK